MDSRVEVLVYGVSGSTAIGSLDLFGDEPISLNMSIADIKDIKKRKTTFTQSFSLPGTKNNNDLFNYLFEIGSDSLFDPRKKTACQLLVDTLPVMTHGNLQLTTISVDDQKKITYEVSVFDEAEDLIDGIGDGELTDLDWSDLDHIWNTQSITSSWTGSSQSYFYPLIDYGYDLNISTLNTGNGHTSDKMFPSTQVKTVIDKIFSEAGYSYNSSFFNSTYFKNLYVPFNGSVNFQQDQSWADDRSFKAGFTGVSAQTKTWTSYATFFSPFMPMSPFNSLPFTDVVNYPNFDSVVSGYNQTTSIYTADTYSVQTFNVTLNHTFDLTTGSTGTFRNYVKFYRSTFGGGTGEFTSASDTSAPGPGTYIKTYSTPTLNGAAGTQYQPAQPGELFWATTYWSASIRNYSSTTGGTATFTYNTGGTAFYNKVETQALPGQLLSYTNFIPKKTKQIDFLNSIITMYNLYVVPDRDNARILKIEPRDAYYASGATKDWSSKLDLSQPVKEQLLSEQVNKRIIYSYKADKDYYNADYTAATTKIFGDYYYLIDNDFVKGDKKIDVIFSPTPSVAVLDSGTFTPPGAPTSVANEFVIPKIGKVDSNNTFGRTDFNIRILQKNDANLIALDSGDSWMLDGVVHYNYPYLGMLNHPSSGTTDLGFDSVDFEYYSLPYITENNLVNTYWKTYLDQISDKNAKLITCNLYLTPADIQLFNFNDSIFIDGLTDDGGHYFIVNKIDYTLTSNGTSKVELIKLNEHIFVPANKPIKQRWDRQTLQSLNLAGGVAYSTGSIIAGQDSVLNSNSPGSLVLGTNSQVSGGAPKSFIIGDNSSAQSPSSFIHGSDCIVGPGVTRSQIFGDNNDIGPNVDGAFIVGSNNQVLNNAVVVVNNNGGKSFSTTGLTEQSPLFRTQIFGDNNIIGNDVVGVHIIGSNNVVPSGLTNVQVYGNDITATTSNTLHTDNISVTNSMKFQGNSNNFIYKEIEIGAWNMAIIAPYPDTKTIAHGLSATEWKTVRQWSGYFRNDADTFYRGILPIDGGSSASLSGSTNWANWPYVGGWNSSIIAIDSGIYPQLSYGPNTYTATTMSRGAIGFYYTPD